MGVGGDDRKSKVCLNYIELAARTHEAGGGEGRADNLGSGRNWEHSVKTMSRHGRGTRIRYVFYFHGIIN